MSRRRAPSRGRPERGLRVALVHDWLTGMRGGERVLEALCELFPHAELFTLLHVPGAVSPTIERHGRDRRSSSGCRGAGAGTATICRSSRRRRAVRPRRFRPVSARSHCAAKSVVAAGRARHLCYCHTPMRYAWDQFDAYFGPARLGAWRTLARPASAPPGAVGRRDDAQPPAPLSSRILNMLHSGSADTIIVAAVVVHPPVDTTFYHARDGTVRPDAVLPGRVGARAVQADRLAIEACRQARRAAEDRRRGYRNGRGSNSWPGRTVEFLGASDR